MGEEWTWELASKAQADLGALSSDEQDRIIEKLDEITDSPWRDPPDYGEPLQNSPYKKIRIGELRLSVTFRRGEQRDNRRPYQTTKRGIQGRRLIKGCIHAASARPTRRGDTPAPDRCV